MANAKIEISHAGMSDLLHDPEVRAKLTALAEQVLAAAKANAPVATGAYRDSLHIEQATTDRAVVRVVSDVKHSFVVEAATGNLSRALDAAGGA